MPDELRQIPTDQIVEPWVLLRPVDKNLVEYIELRDSIESKGFLNSVAVRASDRHPGKWEIIDGMYRWNCAKDLGIQMIPAIEKKGVSDQEVLILQLGANAIRPETKPMDFARQLKRIQRADPSITLSHIASKVSKSPQWVGRQLNLLTLSDTLQTKVDRGEICLQNAFMLARIPPRIRCAYLDDAILMSATEFTRVALIGIKKFRSDLFSGRVTIDNMVGLEPQAYLRRVYDIKHECKRRGEGPIILAATGCKTPLDGWYMALDWVLHLDPESVEIQLQDLRGRTRKKWLS